MKSLTLSITIQRSPQDVYDFASNLANLPKWAPAFVKSIKQEGGVWKAETSFGPHTFRMTEKNSLGVLDHWVTPEGGKEIYVPMRVIPNGGGAEVLFTLFQTPDMDDERFNNDAGFVRKDLNTLKGLLEN